MIYCGSSNGFLHFWEREKLLSRGGRLKGHKLAVLCLATTENMVFSGSADTNICVWKREKGGDHKCLHVLSGHTGPVKCLAVEDERRLGMASRCRWTVYSGSLDKSVKIWRVSVETTEVERQQSSGLPPSSSSRPRSSSGQMFSRMRE